MGKALRSWWIFGEGPHKGGMSISQARGGYGRRRHFLPDCFRDDRCIQEFLKKHFPHMATPTARAFCLSGHDVSHPDCLSCRQTYQAMRWGVVIKRWFVGYISDIGVETDLGWKRGTVKSLVQKIRRALAGERL